jgi:hypothetical protein
VLEVACHQVSEQRIAQALEDIKRRTFVRWHRLRYDNLSLKGLQQLRDELLDHVAARTLDDPAFTDSETRTALRTAAACAHGGLDLSVWPEGDWEIAFPLVDETISSTDLHYEDNPRRTPIRSTWVEAFALGLIGSVFKEPWLTGTILSDHALRSQLRDQDAEPAALAEMDALCGYLVKVTAFDPDDAPILRKPDTEELNRAARRLDEVGSLTPDQRLLRVLLDDDQPAFEQALADRLIRHRESVGEDPEPRSLLPVMTIALAAVAVLAHGWHLGVRSGYVPAGLLQRVQPQ